MNQIPVSGRRFFRIFQRFFKVEAAFQYSKNVFSTNPLSGQWKWIFCLVETVFYDPDYFSAYEIRGKQISQKVLILAI